MFGVMFWVMLGDVLVSEHEWHELNGLWAGAMLIFEHEFHESDEYRLARWLIFEHEFHELYEYGWRDFNSLD